MGDFNFPRRIVDWKESNMGLLADFKEGEEVQKQAFEQLLNLADRSPTGTTRQQTHSW